jgi:hypothetical protein
MCEHVDALSKLRVKTLFDDGHFFASAVDIFLCNALTA